RLDVAVDDDRLRDERRARGRDPVDPLDGGADREDLDQTGPDLEDVQAVPDHALGPEVARLLADVVEAGLAGRAGEPRLLGQLALLHRPAHRPDPGGEPE